MINSVKARTPILALILFVFGAGYTFAANKVVVIPLGADTVASSIAVFAGGEQDEPLGSTDEIVRTVQISAPGAGVILANASGYFGSLTSSGRCSITKNHSLLDFTALMIFDPESSGISWSPFAGTRGFTVTEAGVININLVCDAYSGTGSVGDSQLTATFTPSP